MSSYLEGFRTGQGVVQEGVNAYDRSRSWADRLAERQDADRKAAAALKLDADRYRQASIDKQIDEDRRIDKDAFDRSAKVREMNWDENPKNPANILKEANANKAGRPTVGKNGRSLELNDFQRESLLQKASANYLKAADAKDAAGVNLYGGLIEQYGGEVPEYEDKGGFFTGHTPRYGASKPGADKVITKFKGGKPVQVIDHGDGTYSPVVAGGN